MGKFHHQALFVSKILSGCGIFSNSIALGIHLWKHLQLYSFKIRLGGKICSTEVNMH